MKALRITDSNGFMLLELMVVIAVMGVLASIAIPYFMAYKEKALAAACLSNRRHIEMAERAHYLAHDETSLQIDGTWSCPSGGEYAWLVSAPEDRRYPKAGCSIHYAHLASLPGSQDDVLFSSDFSDMSGLTPLMGDWGITDNSLSPTGGWGEHRLAFGEQEWSDYEMTTNAELSSGWGYGIYYRTDGESDISGYCFQYDPGYGSGAFMVRKVINGREQSPFQRTWIPDGFPVFNHPHEISISVEGDHHVIKIDGEMFFDFTDDSFLSGSAGFRSWHKSDVSFQSTSITETK